MKTETELLPATRDAERRSRLEPLDRAKDLLPWRRAQELELCQLYWMPVASFPVPFRQRQWLLRFAQEFTAEEDRPLRIPPYSLVAMGARALPGGNADTLVHVPMILGRRVDYESRSETAAQNQEIPAPWR